MYKTFQVQNSILKSPVRAHCMETPVSEQCCIRTHLATEGVSAIISGGGEVGGVVGWSMGYAQAREKQMHLAME